MSRVRFVELCELYEGDTIAMTEVLGDSGYSPRKWLQEELRGHNLVVMEVFEVSTLPPYMAGSVVQWPLDACSVGAVPYGAFREFMQAMEDYVVLGKKYTGIPSPEKGDASEVTLGASFVRSQCVAVEDKLKPKPKAKPKAKPKPVAQDKKPKPKLKPKPELEDDDKFLHPDYVEGQVLSEKYVEDGTLKRIVQIFNENDGKNRGMAAGIVQRLGDRIDREDELSDEERMALIHIRAKHNFILNARASCDFE